MDLNLVADDMHPHTHSHRTFNPSVTRTLSHAQPPSPQTSEDEWLSPKDVSLGLGSVISPRYPLKATLARETSQTGPARAQEQHHIVMEPFNYLYSQPGKDIRSKIIASFNAWLQVPKESLDVITDIVRDLHTASLLVDDIEDNSELRRGVPVAQKVFGTPQTLNSANYVYFLSLQKLLKLPNPALVGIWTDELLNLHRGQGMDLFWRDTLTCPTEDDYLDMVSNKTGGLFRLAIRLMQAESQSQIDCIPLVNVMGLIFQILDDYKNLSDTAYTASKGFCEDLTEGKFSLPVIHSVRSDPTNLVLINILKQRTKDESVKRYALTHIEQTGSLAYVRAMLRSLTEKAHVILQGLERDLGDNTGLRMILGMLSVPEPTNGVE